MKKKTFTVECNAVQQNKNQSLASLSIAPVASVLPGKPNTPAVSVNIIFNGSLEAADFIPGKNYTITIEENK